MGLAILLAGCQQGAGNLTREPMEMEKLTYPVTRTVDQVDDTLTLDGLRIVYELNLEE